MSDQAFLDCEPAKGAVANHAGSQRARQQKWRNSLTDSGLVQCNFWVPRSAVADFRLAAEIMRKYPHLTLGPLRDPVSGKLVALKGE